MRLVAFSKAAIAFALLSRASWGEPADTGSVAQVKTGLLEDVTWSANASYECYPRGGRCKAAILEDFDGDGFLDLYLCVTEGSSAQHDRVPNILYLNQGNGTFELNGVECRRPAGARSAYGAVYADFTGHGGDLFICSAGSETASTNVFLTGPFNRKTGFAKEGATAAGVDGVGVRGETFCCAAGDVDGDGWLDLVVGGSGPLTFYRNLGAGKFEDFTAKAGLGGLTGVHACAFANVAGKGALDLYVGMIGTNSGNRLFINDGHGHFTDETQARGILPARVVDAVFFDFDNDGALDLFLARDEEWERTVEKARKPWILYHNDGHGHFTDVTPPELQVTDAIIRSCRAGDLNNDGFLDLVLGVGRNPISHDWGYDRVYLGNGRGGFTEVGHQTDLGHNDGGHGIALGDIDNDGDLDVYLAPFTENLRSHLYRNNTNNDAWLKVKLAGAKPNTSAIGASIFAYRAGHLDDHAALVGLREVTGAYGAYGGGPFMQHFGLGAVREVDLKVIWPNGTVTVRTNVAAATTLVIEQK